MLDFDELNAYEYTDKVVRYLSLRFIRLFNQTKGWLKRKPRELIDDFYEFYEDLYEMTIAAYLDIAKHYYKAEHKKTKIDRKWVEKKLNDYDPVVKYIFRQEVDRKRARHTESVIASETPEKETDTALKYWSNMVRQYADLITDAAYEQGLEDDGITKVRWITQKDERVCEVCSQRDDKIYPITKIPPKPHYGCRCYVRKA